MARMDVLLENYIAHLRVGSYDHERGGPQRVRVDISARLKSMPAADRLDATYDYENIFRAIQEMAARHYDLLETFAAELGERLLRSPLLENVDIRLIKIDLVADRHVGVRYQAP